MTILGWQNSWIDGRSGERCRDGRSVEDVTEMVAQHSYTGQQSKTPRADVQQIIQRAINGSSGINDGVPPINVGFEQRYQVDWDVAVAKQALIAGCSPEGLSDAISEYSPGAGWGNVLSEPLRPQRMAYAEGVVDRATQELSQEKSSSRTQFKGKSRTWTIRKDKSYEKGVSY